MFSTAQQLKSLIGAVIFAFAGAVSAADYSAPAKPAKAVETSGLETARLAIKKWDYKEAIELLKVEAAKDPNNADVQNLLASGEVVVSWAFLAIIAPLLKAGVDAGWVATPAVNDL